MLVAQPEVIVALGSNLGDSVRLLTEAMNRLQSWSAEPLRRSSLWQSDPVDCPPHSPLFLNAVVGLSPWPGETPESLLAKLRQTEIEFGRRPKQVHNEARPLDLDIISFGGETRSSPTLTIPHPRAHLRGFVLEPLAEIAPELILPGQTESVARLAQQLRPTQRLHRLPNPPAG
jgi:2-amino-4-hydroxy-6-hydroxymethyldihydropteridine diphosphokinase